MCFSRAYRKLNNGRRIRRASWPADWWLEKVTDRKIKAKDPDTSILDIFKGDHGVVGYVMPPEDRNASDWEVIPR